MKKHKFFLLYFFVYVTKGDFIFPYHSRRLLQEQVLINFNISDIDTLLSNEAFINGLPSNIQIQSIIDAANVQAVGCPIGFYCPPDTTDPIPCPLGRYGTVPNAVSLEQCLYCPPGYYCPQLATLIPVQCLANTFSGWGQPTCTNCTDGSFSSVGSTTCSCKAGFGISSTIQVYASNGYPKIGLANEANKVYLLNSDGHNNITILKNTKVTFNPNNMDANGKIRLVQCNNAICNIEPLYNGFDYMGAIAGTATCTHTGVHCTMLHNTGVMSQNPTNGALIWDTTNSPPGVYFLMYTYETTPDENVIRYSLIILLTDSFQPKSWNVPSFDNYLRFILYGDSITFTTTAFSPPYTRVCRNKTEIILSEVITFPYTFNSTQHTYLKPYSSTWCYFTASTNSIRHIYILPNPSEIPPAPNVATLGFTCDTCLPTSYKANTGAYSCIPCPGGTFCNASATVTPDNCSANTWSSSGSTNCSQCTSNSINYGVSSTCLCIAGYQPISQSSGLGFTCNSCSIGSYKPSIGQDSCTVCPAGTTCRSTATVSPETCPIGYYCKTNNSVPIHCPVGSFGGSSGLTDFTQCSFCPIGYYCPNLATLTPIVCNAGTNCSMNTFSPTTCNNNTYSFAASERCASCVPDSTSPLGSPNCICNAGYQNQTPKMAFTLISGNSLPKYKLTEANNRNSNFQASDWYAFPPRFLSLSNGYNNMTLKRGQVASFTIQDTNPNSYIAIGTRRAVSLNSAETFSFIDPDVTYGDFITGFAVKLSDCLDNTANCLNPLTDQITGQKTKTIVWNTSTATPGRYFIYYSADGSGGYSFCVTVLLVESYFLKNSWTLDAENSEKVFLYGDKVTFTWSNLNAYWNFDCVQRLTPNTISFQLYAMQIPFTVDSSLYNIRNMRCYTSTVGYTRIGHVYFLDPTTYDLPYDCQGCQLGYYKATSGNLNCQQCSPGTFCNTTATIAPYTCITGSYCPLGTVTPVGCPAGTFRSGSGGSSLSDCSDCPLAKYCDIQTTTPVSCPAGTFRNITNAASLSDCFSCTLGNYCVLETINPTQCPAGTFRNTFGAASVSDCFQCTAGFYCPSNGTVNPLSCPSSYVCAAGTITPVLCLAGTYCPADSPTSLPCPAGYYCPTAGTVTPLACPANFWSTAGSIECLMCTNFSQSSGASTTCACGPGYTNATFPVSSGGSGGSGSFPTTLTVTLIPTDRIEGLKLVPGQNDATYASNNLYFDGTPRLLKSSDLWNNVTVLKGQTVTFQLGAGGGDIYFGNLGAVRNNGKPFIITDYSDQYLFRTGFVTNQGQCDPGSESSSCFVLDNVGITGQGTKTITLDSSLKTPGIYYIYHSYDYDSNWWAFSVLVVDSYATQNTWTIAGMNSEKNLLYGDKIVLTPQTDSTYTGTYDIACRNYGISTFNIIMTGYLPLTWDTASFDPVGKFCRLRRTTGLTSRGEFWFYPRPALPATAPTITVDPSIINNGLGFYCASCQLGSFKNVVSQTPCTPCPAGTFCDTLATSVPKNCSKGKYCPLNTTTPQDCPANTWGYDPSKPCELCISNSSSNPGSVTCQCNAGFSNLSDPVIGPVSTTPTLPSTVTYQVYAAINCPKLNLAPTSTTKVFLVNSDGYMNFSIVKGQTVKFNLNNADSTGTIRLAKHNKDQNPSVSAYLGIQALAKTCTTANTLDCTTLYNTGVSGSNPSSTSITWDTSTSTEGNYLLMYVHDTAASTSTLRFPISILLLPSTNTPTTRTYKVDDDAPKKWVWGDTIIFSGFNAVPEQYATMVWPAPWSFVCYNKQDALSTITTTIDTNVETKLPYTWNTANYQFLKDGSQFCRFIPGNSNYFPWTYQFRNPWDNLAPITVPPSIVTHVVYASYGAVKMGFTQDIANYFLENGDGYMNITVYKGQTVHFDPLLGDTTGKIRLVQKLSTNFYISRKVYNFEFPIFAPAKTCTSSSGTQCTTLYNTGVTTANPTASTLTWDTSTSTPGVYYLMYTNDASASTSDTRNSIVVHLSNSHITPNSITKIVDDSTSVMFWGDTVTFSPPSTAYTAPMKFTCFNEASWGSWSSPTTTVSSNVQFPYTFVSNNYPSLNPYNSRSTRQFCVFQDSTNQVYGTLSQVVPNPYQPAPVAPIYPSTVTYQVYAANSNPTMNVPNFNTYKAYLINSDNYMNFTVIKGQTVTFNLNGASASGKIWLVTSDSPGEEWGSLSDSWYDGIYTSLKTCSSGSQCSTLYNTGVSSANPSSTSIVWDSSTSTPGYYFLIYVDEASPSTTRFRYGIVVMLLESYYLPTSRTFNGDYDTPKWAVPGDVITISGFLQTTSYMNTNYPGPYRLVCYDRPAYAAFWTNYATPPTTTIATNIQFPYVWDTSLYTFLKHPYSQICFIRTSVDNKFLPEFMFINNPYASLYKPTSNAVTLGFTCLACLVANYKPSVGQTQCIPCPAGTFCNSNATITPQTCTAGYYCLQSTVNPSACLANSWSTSGFSQCKPCTQNSVSLQTSTTCSCISGFSPLTNSSTDLGFVCPACVTGYYKNATGQGQCLPCPPGTFCQFLGTVNPSSCPTGSYCPLNTTTPIFCPGGTYMPNINAQKLADCITCVSGAYCPVNTTTPISCPNGTYSSTTGASSSAVCQTCSANFYCPVKSVNPVPCPANTNSQQGSSTILQCRCNPGYKCTYSKIITAAVTLNTTYNDFHNNINGVREAFINAVAAAAKVDRSKVFIIGYSAKTGGRRLLARSELEKFTSEGLTVVARVHGATELHNLEYHLSRHHKNLHIEHNWNDNHSMQIK